MKNKTARGLPALCAIQSIVFIFKSVIKYLLFPNQKTGGKQCRSLLRHCATSRKGAGSIPGGVTGIFH